MTEDERAIRDLVETWLAAWQSGRPCDGARPDGG